MTQFFSLMEQMAARLKIGRPLQNLPPNRQAGFVEGIFTIMLRRLGWASLQPVTLCKRGYNLMFGQGVKTSEDRNSPRYASD
jgi:hypothetical protein